MGQITKEFAESLLKRTQEGKHINTTVWEEEQLIRGWLHWREHNRELLEALEGVVAVADRDTVEFNRARAAIAKAK